MRDQIFKKPPDKLAGFEFNQEVADVFDDMLARSIPFYDEVARMIVALAAEYYIDDSAIYDLGCSTGSLAAAFLQQLDNVAQIVAIDNAPPMIEKCRQRFASLPKAEIIQLVQNDIRNLAIENASVVNMSYTLHFIRPLYRLGVVRKIFEGLLPGGVFILSEKVLEESNHLSRLFMDMYYRFKCSQGYSELEISSKRDKLENVLIPYQVAELQALLSEAGFRQVGVFFKWHNFASIVAIKDLD